MTGSILIIEHDPGISHIIEEILDLDGHTVINAIDGIKALHLLRTGKYDIVITDIRMQAMYGVELMNAIKVSDPASEVIVLAGHKTMDTAIEMIQTGGYDFLLIPDELSRPDRLQTMVQHALEKQRLERTCRELVSSHVAHMPAHTREAEALNLHHEVSRILTGSGTIAEMAPKVIVVFLDGFGWNAGAMWLVNHESSVLQCVGVHHAVGISSTIEAFVNTRRQETHTSGNGVPGKVWATGRHASGTQTGESGSFQSIGFPILLGDSVVGALEFFHKQIAQPDEHTIRMMTTIGNHLGLFIECEQLEEQGRQSQKMDALGRLAGGIAHDFNNLLSAIIGNAHLIERQIDPEAPYYKYTSQIQKTGHRAAALVQQLLAFGRNQTLQLERMNLNRVVSHLEPVLQQLLHEGIKFNINLESSDEQVLMDRTQLEQVMTNLVVNARDAMPNGGFLTLRTKTADLSRHEARRYGIAAGMYVRLDVQDTGHGMDETVQTRLFEPFFTTKEKGKGTGLGLATVYAIVTQCGGTIRVSSESGVGTIFSIYLPVLMVRAGQTPREKTASVTQTTSSSDSVHTILIVEDEKDLRFIVRQILEQHGYTVLEATNGIDALERIDQHTGPIHLVVTDLYMPEMNGVEFIEQLRQSQPHMKVIFISGSSSRRLLDERGYDETTPLLAKPFDLDELVRYVRKSFDASQ